MGIQGLTPFLKKFAPLAFSTVHLSRFSKKKIAIDISLFLYKYKVIYGEQWLSGVLQMLTLLRSHSIHPIIIFDGEAPVEKMEEQQSRRASREERIQRYNQLTSNLEVYTATGVISNELQDFHNRNAIKFGVNSTFDIDLVTSQLDKLKNQTVRINHSDIELVQELVNVMCIPYFQASSEAEGMCSWLCKHQIVDAVLTEDTDVLAYGANKFLSKLNLNGETCVLVDYYNLLHQLSFDAEQFTEFCIMCGCDYNQRIKGLGPVRAYKLLQKHQSIENIMIEHPTIDVSSLKHERIKEMFNLPQLDSIEHSDKIKTSRCGKPNYEKLSAFMFKHDCMTHHPQYVYNSCLQDVNIEDDDFELVKVAYKRRKSPSIKI